MTAKNNKSQTSEKLEQKEAQLSAIINAIGDGLLVLKTDGTIELYNDAAVQILGYIIYNLYHQKGELEILGKKLTAILSFFDAGSNKVDIVKEVVESKLPQVREDLYFYAGDSKTILYTNASPVFDEKESVNRVIVLFRDITAEKELQERMEEFISVTSHELRTPVAVIEGNLSTALLPGIGSMDDKIKKFVKNAYDNTVFLSKLIQNLTTLRKIEAKKVSQEELEEFNLRDLVEEVVNDYAPNAKKKGLELSFHVANPQMPKIHTSRTELKQVLINLVDNALKYTSQGFVKIDIDLDNKKQEFYIKIIDSGMGIKKEYQKKLFSRFYRAEDWRTRKTGGTGLGLYITKQIVNHLAGEISFTSVASKGTTFTVKLPVKPSETPRPLDTLEAGKLWYKEKNG